MTSTAAPYILVVDDHTDTRQLLVRVLQVVGYRAVAVPDGRQALLFLNAHRPDLIILDRMMPEVDGFEVLRQLRANPRDAALPVILYSAAADPDSMTEALELGAQAFVGKGTGWEKLVYEIQRLAGPPQPAAKSPAPAVDPQA